MDADRQELLRHVTMTARSLPVPLVLQVADLFEVADANHLGRTRRKINQLVTQAPAQTCLDALWAAWQQTNPLVPAEAIAWALRSALETDEWHKANLQLEMVWSGPTPQNCDFRRTDQALLHLIGQAQHSLWIVTFAAYKIPAVAAALEEAAARGVVIHFVAESSKESDGGMTWGAIEAIGGHLPKQTAVYIWPHEKRPPNERGQRGALHAKCAVADETLALVSSANLTNHALNLNMEMGLLVSGGTTAADFVTHLKRLIKENVLMRIEVR